VIDCSTFHDCEIDALYSSRESDAHELDTEASAAMEQHAATCPSCAARLRRLRTTRERILAVAIEPVPRDFESRIMAAVDAGLARRAAAPPMLVGPAAPAAHAPPSGSPANAGGGAKILKLMARPSFAVAATFVLVLGGAAFLMTRSASMKSMAARNDEAPSLSPAATMAAGQAPEPAASMASPPPPDEAPLAFAAPTATVSPPSAAFGPGGGGGPSPAAAPAAPVALAAKASKSSATSADDRAFAAAKSLYDAGAYAQALPKFEALKASNSEAELYAARCIAKTQGCAAAVPRYDQAALRNAGTETGSRAQIEGAKCYQATGDVVAARKRLEAAKDEGVLAAEAEQGLDALDAKPGAGTPSTGVKAAPRAAPSKR
jgi:hypothetical protein